MRSEEIRWRGIVEGKDKSIQSLTDQLNEKERFYEKTVLLKDKDIEKLTDEIERKIQTIEEL